MRHGFVTGIAVTGMLAACLVTGCSQQVDPSDAVVFDSTLSLTEAQTQSTESGKPALVFVQALWCPLCTRVREETLSDPTVESLVKEQFVGASISVSERRIEPAAQAELIRLDVRVVPTLVLYAGADEIARIEGVVEPEALIAWLSARGAADASSGATTTLAIDE